MKHFTDLDFDCSDILKYSSSTHWKRPHQLVQKPYLKTCEFPSTAFQGIFEDCWLISALSCCNKNRVWDSIVSQETVLCKNAPKYTGKVAIKLWQFGDWIEIVIDDKLPVVENTSGEVTLLGAYCSITNDFWAALIEKAFAKYFKGYSMLKSGQVSTGFILLTGGFVWKENFKTDSCTGQLANKISSALKNNCLIFFHLKQLGENVLHRTLVNYHYYEIKSISNDRTTIEISTTWKDFENYQLPLNTLCDCEAEVSFCSEKLENIFNITKTKSSLNSKLIFGHWKPFSSCGGNAKCKTFYQNPKYIVECTKSTENTLIFIELFQCSSQKILCVKQGINVFVTVKCDDSCRTFTYPFGYTFSNHISLAIPLSLDQNLNEITVVPSTYEANVNAYFSLRITTWCDFDIIESNEENAVQENLIIQNC